MKQSTTPITEISKTWKILIAKPLLFFLIVLIDLVFFIAYGFFTGPIQMRIVEHAVLIGNKLSADGVSTGILGHVFSAEYRELLLPLLALLALFFIVGYIVYVIFQATSWHIARRLAHVKEHYYEYFISFAKINLFWLALIVVWATLKLFVDVRHTIAKTLIEGAVNMLGGIMQGVLALIIAAACLSYARRDLLALIRIPLKQMLGSLGICGLILSGALLVTWLFSLVSLNASILAGAFLFFPSISFIKVYLVQLFYVRS